MRILFVSSEVAPFSKTGGLADVAGALPEALAKLGHEVRVVTPLYATVKNDGRIQRTSQIVRLRFPFGDQLAAIHEAQLGPRHAVWFLDHPGFFRRGGIYGDNNGDYTDNHRRFGFLSVAALTAAQVLKFPADIVHLNDWQTGLAAVALKRGYQGTELRRAKSVFTIHNLAYQGMFSKGIMQDLGLPWELFTENQLEFHDGVNFMKAGLAFADALTTVSRRYAQEIQTPEYGNNLDAFIRARSHKLHGILNGVDYDEWDPRTDRFLPARYSADDLSGKARCKDALLDYFNLSGGVPVFGAVTRLAGQKGIDILIDGIYRMLHRDLRVVVVGSGEARFESGLRQLAHLAPGKVAVKIGFDNALAHLIEAGSDFFLMPSRYEPCGLNQMYSLRYGTPPIVRATGGLDDTVIDAGQPNGNGVKFEHYQGSAVAWAIDRAIDMYWNPDWMGPVRRRGMLQDFSWDVSARRYEELYASLG